MIRHVVVLVLEMPDDQARQSPPTVWDWPQIVGPELVAHRVIPAGVAPVRTIVEGRNITEEPTP